jgi:hypothetical protein
MTVSGYSQKVVDRYENHWRYVVDDGGVPIWEPGPGSEPILFDVGDMLTCVNNTNYIVTFTVEDVDHDVIYEGTVGGPGGVFGAPIPWYARYVCVRKNFAGRIGRLPSTCLSMEFTGEAPYAVPTLPSYAIALLVITITIIGAMMIRRRLA